MGCKTRTSQPNDKIKSNGDGGGGGGGGCSIILRPRPRRRTLSPSSASASTRGSPDHINLAANLRRVSPMNQYRHAHVQQCLHAPPPRRVYVPVRVDKGLKPCSHLFA
jgi:hypothetical protein